MVVYSENTLRLCHYICFRFPTSIYVRERVRSPVLQTIIFLGPSDGGNCKIADTDLLARGESSINVDTLAR